MNELFSWKSPTARQQGITPGAHTDDDLLALLAAEPRLIRRPLIVQGARIIIGADLKQIEAAIAAP